MFSMCTVEPLNLFIYAVGSEYISRVYSHCTPKYNALTSKRSHWNMFSVCNMMYPQVR